MQADAHIDYDSLKNDIISRVKEALASSAANEQQQRNYADATVSEATATQVARTNHVQNYVSQRNQYEIRIDGISKLGAPNATEQIENDRQTISNVLTCLDEGHKLGHIDNIEPLGRFDKGKKRPRTVLVRFKTEFAPQKILAKAYLMIDYDKKFYISPPLSESGRKIEQKVLKKRLELLDVENVDRQVLKSAI